MATKWSDGDGYYKEEKYARALDCYRHVINQDVTTDEKIILLKRQADCLLKLEKYLKAAALCDQCIGYNIDDKEAILTRIQALIGLDRLDDAIQDAMGLDKLNGLSIEDLGRFKSKLANPLKIKAMEWYEEGNSLLNKGKLLEATSFFLTAFNCCELQRRMMGHDKEVFKQMYAIDRKLAVCLFKTEKFAESEHCCRRCLTFNPLDTEIMYQMCLTLECQQRYMESWGFALGLLRLEPTHQETQLLLQRLAEKGAEMIFPTEYQTELKEEANSLYQKGSYEESAKVFSKLVHMGDNHNDGEKITAYEHLASCFIHLDKWEETIENCSKCLEITNENAKALYMRSKAYEMLGMYRKAFEDARKAVAGNRSNKDFGRIYFRLKDKFDKATGLGKKGTQCFKDGEFEEAFDCYEKAKTLDIIPESEQIKLTNNQASCCLKLDKFEEAVGLCSEYLTIFPSESKALYKRCQAYEGLGNNRASLDDAKKVPENYKDIQLILKRLEEKSDKVVKNTNCGVQLYKEHKYTEALEYFEEAKGLNASSVLAEVKLLINMASCYNQLQRFPEAVNACTKCLAIKCSKNKDKIFKIRCHALIGMMKYKEAWSDAQEISKTDPELPMLLGMIKFLIENEAMGNMKAEPDTSICQLVDISQLQKYWIDVERKEEIDQISILEKGVLHGQELLEKRISPDQDLEVRLLLCSFHVGLARLYFKMKRFVDSVCEMEDALEVCDYSLDDVLFEYLKLLLPTALEYMLNNHLSKEMKRIYYRQQTGRRSRKYEVWQCAFTVSIQTADALRKTGEKDFNNELLKNLIIQHAKKMIDTNDTTLQKQATVACEKALEYDAKDFQALKLAALIYNRIGNSKKALEHCKDALKIHKDDDLLYLKIELDIDIENAHYTVQKEEKLNKEWLEGTQYKLPEKQHEQAEQARQAYLLKPKKKVRYKTLNQFVEEKVKKTPSQVTSLASKQIMMSLGQTDSQTLGDKTACYTVGCSTADLPDIKTRHIKTENKPSKPFATLVPPVYLAKMKANISSKLIFISLCKIYDLKLDCNICKGEKACPKCKLDRLKLRPKNGQWEVIRNVPANCEGSIELCEEIATEDCSKGYLCKNPHSSQEQTVWKLCLQHNWDVEALVTDLRETDLRLSSVISEIDFPKEINIFQGCKKCITNKQYSQSRKNVHEPLCGLGHPWESHGTPIMVEFSKDVILPLQKDIDIPPEQTVLRSKLDALHNLVNSEFEAFEIVGEVQKSKKQRAIKPIASRGGSVKKQYDLPNTVFADVDTNFDDIVEGQDVDCDMPYPDEKENCYYKQMSCIDLERHLRKDPMKYQKCEITLQGPQNAVCRPLFKKGLDGIEIRGRKNCGKAADGDIVVVEVMNVKSLQLDDDESVKRGRVVGVLRQKTNRKAYNFVCRIDTYQWNLMWPICGKIPKIHIETKTYKKINKDQSIKREFVNVYEMNGTKIHFVKQLVINPKEKHNYLYVVKYVKWDEKCMYPYGFVAKVIDAGKTSKSAQTVLDLMYQVPKMYNSHSIDRACYKELLDFSQKCEDERQDITETFVISIDPPNCKDVDDALSVTTSTRDGKVLYEVGIHIADVSSFVQIDSRLDKEAFHRRITFYPATTKPDRQAHHMLPKEICEDLCSLVENKKRLGLSLFVQLDTEGAIHGDPSFKQTQIINKRQMTYSEAQEILNHEESTTDLSKTVHTLFKLAQSKRKNRLREGHFHREFKPIISNDDDFHDAHILVEEFMILANVITGQYLTRKFQKNVPLNKQKAPSESRNKQWLLKHKSILTKCFYLPRFYPDHVTRNVPASNPQHFSILKGCFDQIKNAFTEKSVPNIVEAVSSEIIHPSYTVAYCDWEAMQNKAEISLFTDTVEDQHYNLQKSVYTWFTSPLRRYIDIVIHRMIISTLKNIDFPYKLSHLQAICDKFNRSLQRQKNYKSDCQRLQTALFLQKAPIFVPSVVSSFSGEYLQLDWPLLGKAKKETKQLRLSNLILADKPVIDNDKKEMAIHWQKRIYDLRESTTPFARLRYKEISHSSEVIAIDNMRHVHQIPSAIWKKLFQMIKGENSTKILCAAEDIVQGTEYNKDGYFEDITSEMKDEEEIVKHHVKFKMNMQRGSTLQVQVGATFTRGFIVPQIQLVSISPTIDFCVEHRRDPIECFSKIAVKLHKDTYNSVHDYKETWLPMLAMEAAFDAVNNGDAILINNAAVQLYKTKQSFTGVIKVDYRFCKKRQINFFANNKDQTESMPEEEDEAQDFICMRIPIKPSSNVVPGDNKNVKKYITWKNVWTAHCVINPKKSYVEGEGDKDEDKTVVVHFSVHQFTAEPPTYILSAKQGDNVVLASIELLTKSLPHRRMEAAVHKLKQATDFCKKIVLGRPCEEEQVLYKVSRKLDINVKDAAYPLPSNNPTQEDAIRTALQQRFTLIQGPPGTGKTLTGVKLVYWFSAINTERCTNKALKKQVMYCGPSNSAVDVAARCMKNRLGEVCPKIIRVYSELLENQIFPLPRDAMVINSSGRRYEMGGRQDLNDISLHHLTRKRDKKDEKADEFARQILHWDERFKTTKPESIKDAEVLKYQKLLTDASVHQIKKYDVILCTCSVSASPRMIKASYGKIAQCIIDESGMCMEPETLIPLVSHKPDQVVLIGDHKQLRPIVTHKLAKDLGLDKSMFERQASIIAKSRGNRRQNVSRLIMLDVQYRMHEKICAFPSDHFYKSALKTKVTSYWKGRLLTIWPNPEAPIVFCHVAGAEEGLAVSTSEGGENSKSNKAEIENVVRIYLTFINTLGVKMKDITILSQYKSQCTKIKEQLKDRGISNPNVSTVVASQGDEWDVVILSTVRSLPDYEIDRKASKGWKIRNLGFIIDHNQINVAITRARKGLVIVGNGNLLRCDGGEDGMWAKLLDHYESMGAIVNAQDFPCRREERNVRRAIYTTKTRSAALPPRLERNLQS